MNKPAKYLIIIESSGAMTARLFDASKNHLMDFDASSEEVSLMTAGLRAAQGAAAHDWHGALDGHNQSELAAASVYELNP